MKRRSRQPEVRVYAETIHCIAGGGKNRAAAVNPTLTFCDWIAAELCVE